MIVINADEGVPSVKELQGEPGPELQREIHELIGGFLERVPQFDSIEYPMGSRVRHRCVAFCNEDGKRLQLTSNTLADVYWAMSQLKDHTDEMIAKEWLVGNVVVIFGDQEFMERL